MSDQDELTEYDLRNAISEMPVVEESADDILDCPLGDGFNLDEHLANIHRHFLKRAMKEATSKLRPPACWA